MIAVIQCAATKRRDAGLLRRQDGTPVKFVAHPALAPASSDYAYARPDDISDTGPTWRERLLEYNNSPGDNALGLLRAFELYVHDAYRRIVEHFGLDKAYVLSAGWGLIRAAFLTPDYDITFSASADAYKRRGKADSYDDLSMLPTDTAEPIVFFGGKDYVPLFCKLTRGVEGTRTIFYNSAMPPHAFDCVIERYSTTTRTNWHYECVDAFVSGRIPPSQR